MRRVFMVYVDDERPTPSYDETQFVPITCHNYDQAVDVIQYLSTVDQPFTLDLDHDLGEGKTGYDICKYLVEHQLAVCGCINIHSMNPVGVSNMEQLLTHYGYTVTRQ